LATSGRAETLFSAIVLGEHLAIQQADARPILTELDAVTMVPSKKQVDEKQRRLRAFEG
jgi:hypothetical protein